MQKKVIFLLWIILVLIGISAVAGILNGIFPKDRVIVPHITPTTTGTPPIVARQEFPFEQSMITISVPVNRSVFEGARQAEKAITIYGNVSEKTWMGDSYQAMAGDPAQEELYTILLTELRKVKAGMGLDDDEYAELISAYVQSLRYETIAENPAKFPIETVVDGSGDCDDKSLLLAGLLSREDYDVALFSFVPESHMAVGLGSDHFLYKNTNYSFVETTNFSYIGVSTGILGNGIVLTSYPVIIPIGKGSKIYHKGSESQYISDMRGLSEKNAKEIEGGVLTMEQDLKSRKNSIATLEQQMATLRASGDISGYNARVSEHNGMVSDYNSRLEQYRKLRTQYETYATVYNYIISHQYDRQGVYTYIKTNLP